MGSCITVTTPLSTTSQRCVYVYVCACVRVRMCVRERESYSLCSLSTAPKNTIQWERQVVIDCFTSICTFSLIGVQAYDYTQNIGECLAIAMVSL